ncbi:MAG: hypothetical protein DRI90_11410 [Deltaproteobacteria bacterium]|nr:MAG: hypothetical protein DRI90_11410 [Deltaproteobacteria bacterium]
MPGHHGARRKALLELPPRGDQELRLLRGRPSQAVRPGPQAAQDLSQTAANSKPLKRPARRLSVARLRFHFGEGAPARFAFGEGFSQNPSDATTPNAAAPPSGDLAGSGLRSHGLGPAASRPQCGSSRFPSRLRAGAAHGGPGGSPGR